MIKEQVKEICQCLDDCQRRDLIVVLCEFFAKHEDKEKDPDYKPPLVRKEPREEYDSDTGEEEELDIGCSPDGFHYLK